jgi:hypothetical protein
VPRRLQLPTLLHHHAQTLATRTTRVAAPHACARAPKTAQQLCVTVCSPPSAGHPGQPACLPVRLPCCCCEHRLPAAAYAHHPVTAPRRAAGTPPHPAPANTPEHATKRPRAPPLAAAAPAAGAAAQSVQAPRRRRHTAAPPATPPAAPPAAPTRQLPRSHADARQRQLRVLGLAQHRQRCAGNV